MITFGQLRVDHNNGVRPVPIKALRDTFADCHWRRWQSWRSLAECPPRAQKISQLSAIKLWLLATTHGSIAPQLSTATIALVQQQPERLEQWLKAIAWEGCSSHAVVMSAINGLNPEIDVIHHQRLYHWFERAGLQYSTRRTYSQRSICRVVAIASQGVGLGRPRAG